MVLNFSLRRVFKRLRFPLDVIADVLSTYLDGQLDKLCDRFGVGNESKDAIPAVRKFKKRIERLNRWWGPRCSVKSMARRAAPTRGSAGRREALAALPSAIMSLC